MQLIKFKIDKRIRTNKRSNYMKHLIKSILAGIMIGIGATTYLSLENKIVGSILFSIGLFIILTKELNLFTGKIGYIFNNGLAYLKEVFITLIGNFIGTFSVGCILGFTRIANLVSTEAERICTIKLNDDIISIFILSIFCGILMYLAVNGYKEAKDNFAKYAGVFLGVSVFILCGFEHCVANMYYFTVAGMWSLKTLGYLGIMILGNTIGGVSFPLADKLLKKCEK